MLPMNQVHVLVALDALFPIHLHLDTSDCHISGICIQSLEHSLQFLDQIPEDLGLHDALRHMLIVSDHDIGVFHHGDE